MRISLTSVSPWFQNHFTSRTQPRHHRALFGVVFLDPADPSTLSHTGLTLHGLSGPLSCYHATGKRRGILRNRNIQIQCANDSHVTAIRDSSFDLDESSVLPQCYLPRFGWASCSGHVLLDIFSIIFFLLGIRILPPSADSANTLTALGRVLRRFTSCLSNTGSSVQPRNWGNV